MTDLTGEHTPALIQEALEDYPEKPVKNGPGPFMIGCGNFAERVGDMPACEIHCWNWAASWKAAAIAGRFITRR